VGGGICSPRTFFGKGGGGLQMWTSALFAQKKFGLFEIYGVSARARGSIFRDLCGHLFWTAPYV